jgi:gluconolactonase
MNSTRWVCVQLEGLERKTAVGRENEQACEKPQEFCKTRSCADMSIEVFESEMKRLVDLNSKLIKLASGFQFTEGPAWNGDDHCLYFSDIPADTIFRYSENEEVQVFRKPSHYANGLAFDSQGRLVTCEHETRRVTRSSATRVEIIADHYQGKRLNSPNDVIVAHDNSILFTDPLYGLREGLGGPGVQELDFQGLYRVPPNSYEPILMVDDFEAPNGLALSPDESCLYVNDTVLRHIRKFKVDEEWKLIGGEVLIEIKAEGEGKPDGMKLDAQGNIYCTGPRGVWVCSQEGSALGRILLPEKASNLAWGDSHRRTLFITASTSIYQISVLVQGHLAS